MRLLTFRMFAVAASVVGHSWVASTLFTIPLHRERTEVKHTPGVLVPAAGFSIQEAILLFVEEEGSAAQIDRPAPPRIEPGGAMLLTFEAVMPVTPEFSELDEDAQGTVMSAEPTPIAGTDRQTLIRSYIGQIHARVERAWDPLPGARYPFCRVRVMQDIRGEVLEASADECAMEEPERGGLLAAIRRASPLPAPADMSLFVPEFLLEFGE